MRRLLILVLCLLLPLQGFGAGPQTEAPCPMQASMVMDETQSNPAQPAAEAMADCCNDPETALRTGHSCKSTQDCTAPVVWLPPAESIALPNLAAQTLGTTAASGLPPGAIARLWRPPASV